MDKWAGHSSSRPPRWHAGAKATRIGEERLGITTSGSRGPPGSRLVLAEATITRAWRHERCEGGWGDFCGSGSLSVGGPHRPQHGQQRDNNMVKHICSSFRACRLPHRSSWFASRNQPPPVACPLRVASPIGAHGGPFAERCWWQNVAGPCPRQQRGVGSTEGAGQAPPVSTPLSQRRSCPGTQARGSGRRPAARASSGAATWEGEKARDRWASPSRAREASQSSQESGAA